MFSRTNLDIRDRNLESQNDYDNQPFSPRTQNHQIHFPTMNTLPSMKNIRTMNSKISHLLEPEQQLGSKCKIITMLSSIEDNFHFHDEAARVLNRYSHNNIAFIGIWGAHNSEKAYFYDKILKLCGIEDEKYTQSMINTSDQCNMVFYQRPFIKDSLKIFLLDCKGYNNDRKLKRKQKIQLDMMMSICQILILVENQQSNQDHERRDIIDIGYDHFNESFKRLYVNKTQEHGQCLKVEEISWPKSLFVLYSDSQSIKKSQEGSEKEEDLRKMFSDFNFSILHNMGSINKKNIQSYTTIVSPLDELYLKNSQSIFESIYSKLSPKYFNNLKCTGFTMPFVISQLNTSLNNHNSIFLPAIFEKVRKQVYGQLYNRHALNYVLKLKEYIPQEKAYNMSYLLQVFDRTNTETLNQWDWSYGKVIAGKGKTDKLYQQYEGKLEQYIKEKQQNIMQVNYKKSQDQLSVNPQFILGQTKLKNQAPSAKLSHLRSQFQTSKRNYDLNAESEAVGNNLKLIFSQNDQFPNKYQQNKSHIQFLEVAQKKQQLTKKRQFLKTIYLEKQSKIQISQKQKSQLELYKRSQQQIDNQINKYRQRIMTLREQKEQLESDRAHKNAIDKLIIEKNRQNQQLFEQLKASKMVRTNLIEQEAKDVLGKSQLLGSKLQEKKKIAEEIQKSIFKSKVQFYQKNKVAEKRIIQSAQTFKSKFKA